MTTRSDASFWDLLENATQADSVRRLGSAARTALRAIGFDAVYLVAPVIADPEIGRALANFGFDPQWARRYREEYYAIDPLPQLALTRQSAFRWHDDIDRTGLTEAQRAYLDMLPGFGMAEGLAIGCFGPFARTGFVGVGHPASSDAFSSRNRLKVEVCARIAFKRYVHLVQPYDTLPPPLSQRELDVLRWIGEGKSNSVIADILQISRSSVDSYVKRVFAKLGVTDRTSASVRGLALGLIESGSLDPSKVR